MGTYLTSIMQELTTITIGSSPMPRAAQTWTEYGRLGMQLTPTSSNTLPTMKPEWLPTTWLKHLTTPPICAALITAMSPQQCSLTPKLPRLGSLKPKHAKRGTTSSPTLNATAMWPMGGQWKTKQG